MAADAQYVPYVPLESNTQRLSERRAYWRYSCVEALCGGIIISGVLLWCSLAIAALTHTPAQSLATTCPATRLWWFLCVAVIALLVPLLPVAAHWTGAVYFRARARCVLAVVGIAQLTGVYLWGIVEVFGDACASERLGTNPVFRLSCTWIVIVTICLLFVVAALGSGGVKTCTMCGCDGS